MIKQGHGESNTDQEIWSLRHYRYAMPLHSNECELTLDQTLGTARVERVGPILATARAGFEPTIF